MSRPPETFSKVAAVFGVTRQAVHKWMHKGAPMYSAEALVDWLSNQMGTRVLDNFQHRCPVLLENLKAVMEPRSVYKPDKELAEMFGVRLETIQAWRLRGAPVEDIGELAEWAMKEPGIFEGFARNQEAADTLEAIEDPEMEGEIREALSGWRSSPTGRAWKRMAGQVPTDSVS
jgi:hypothetical protein